MNDKFKNKKIEINVFKHNFMNNKNIYKIQKTK